MKNNKLNLHYFIITVLGISIVCHMCGVSKYPSSSNPGTYSITTGVKYNSPDGLKVKPYTKTVTGNGKYVEGGSITVSSDFDGYNYIKGSPPNRARTIAVPSMIVDETPIKNIDWKEMLEWLKRFAPKKYSEFYKKLKQDPNIWMEENSYNEPIVKLYNEHPLFGIYPVVGINFVQAVFYCFWRTFMTNLNLIKNMKKFDVYKDFGKYSLKEIANYDLKEIEGYDLAKFADLKLSQVAPKGEEGEGEFEEEEDGLEGENEEFEDEDEDEEFEDEEGEETTSYDKLEELRNEGSLSPEFRLPTSVEHFYFSAGAFTQQFQKSAVNHNKIQNQKDFYQDVQYKDKYNGTKNKSKNTKEGILVKNQKPNPWNSLRFRDNNGTIMSSRKLGPGTYTDTVPPYAYKYKPNPFGIFHSGVSELVLDIYREVYAEEYHDLNPIFRKHSNKDRESDYKDFNPRVTDKMRVYIGPNYLDTFSVTMYTRRPIPEYGPYSKKSFIGFRCVQTIISDIGKSAG